MKSCGTGLGVLPVFVRVNGRSDFHRHLFCFVCVGDRLILYVGNRRISMRDLTVSILLLFYWSCEDTMG